MCFATFQLPGGHGARLAAALFLLSLLPARAQAPVKFPADPIRYGQIAPADLTAAPFTGDSAAAAVVLCDYARSRMEGKGKGLQVVFERVTRVKILRKAGYDEATVEISLYHRDLNQEKVTNLRGCTYNLVNGRVEKTPLEPGGAFLEKRNARINVQKFTLPNVREGSVIEYAYTLSSDFLFNFQDWTFQRAIPVRWSEYRVSIPTFYKYKIIYQGTQPLSVDQVREGSASMHIESTENGFGSPGSYLTANTEDHRWVLQQVPALRPEPFITTTDDYVDRLDFQLVGEQWPDHPFQDLSDTWPKINERLLAEETFGQQLDRGHLLKEQMLALAARYPAPAARAAAVRELVMTAVRYDGTNRYSTETTPRKAYEAHRGSSADVNLLLIAALRDAGLAAEPVLLSTRDHGRVSQEFPLLDRFNYVLALVPLPDGHDLLVDSTEPLLPCGVLPPRCLNQVGRLIAAGRQAEGRWVSLAPSLRAVRYCQANLTLDASGGLTGQVRQEFSGYAGLAVRQELAELGEKKFGAALAARHEGWSIPRLVIANRDSVEQALRLGYSFSRPGSEVAPADQLYISPLREFTDVANPFRHDTRRYPVDFGTAEDEIFLLNLTLPAGYEVAELPKNAVVQLPDGSARFVFRAATTGTGVQLSSRLVLNSPVYAAAQYANLRELYHLMLARQGERLVLQKKPGG